MASTRVRRHLEAPPSAVYAALTDPESVRRWKVPSAMTCEIHEFDAREGGRLRVSLTYDDASLSGKTEAHTDTYTGWFEQLVADSLVVEVDEFETDDPSLKGEMRSTIGLIPIDGGTELIAVHEGLPPGIDPALNQQGWEEALDRLAALVERS
jgi:uncharacterized protein YndB with AHSA1/START domain